MKISLPAIALLIGTVPIVAINFNYLIAASAGSVPWCVPYWDSCTSISATGREGFAFIFFKLTMVPIAICYAIYWKLTQASLRSLGYQGNTIRNLGYISTLALLMYVLALGAVGDHFRLTRRIGIIFYFTLTYLCQLLSAYQLRRLNVSMPGIQGQIQLCATILAIGVLTLFLDALLANYDDYEDAFEWNVSLLLHINFLLSWWGWKNYTNTDGVAVH
ncbi:MAG: hypothetical protein ACI8PP_000987 [Candidatus Pseudothioglobus sp.]|jgi:hypothetical protein